MKSLLVVCLIGICTLFEARAQPCLENPPTLKKFDTTLLPKLEGDWYFTGWYDSSNTVLSQTRCIHVHFEPNLKPGTTNLVLHQRYTNETRVENGDMFLVYDNVNPNKATLNIGKGEAYMVHLIDYDQDKYLIYYACIKNKDVASTLFLFLTREFGEPNGDALNARRNALKVVRLAKEESKIHNFNDKEVCGLEDPIWNH